MADNDIRAKKVLSVVKPILASILEVSGKDIPWGRSGVPAKAQAEALLGEGGEGGGKVSDFGRLLRAYYSLLSSLRNQASANIRWGKRDIPELEHMDSTLAGLYAFISEHVLGFESRLSDSGEG
ncbi:MAG TPA: hypothetical protein VK465_16965 [Fibrobacteria bacterium]|nr:hypothetical protein [Fibrobacteria bacterium]